MSKKRLLEELLLLIIAAGAVYLFFLVKKDHAQLYIPQQASSYSILNATCSDQSQNCSLLIFSFQPSENAKQLVPSFDVNEIPDEAKTEIVFHSISNANVDFSYGQITANPLIDDIETNQMGSDFYVTIHRQGALTTADVSEHGGSLDVELPTADASYPLIKNISPGDNTSVNPGLQKIQFEADLTAPLLNASVNVQNNPLSLGTVSLGTNSYKISAAQAVAAKNSYKVLAIVTDSANRSTAAVWTFDAQAVSAPVSLGANRFQYLGWWGQINKVNASVKEGPSLADRQIGTFSTANRVKVLKEVSGDDINGNSTWYQIDGGRYPGAYVFSGDVTPIAEPQPEKNIAIPQGVSSGDYWIDVNVTKEILTLFQYNKPVFATYVSTGRSISPTVLGTFRIWNKLEKTRMHGGPPVTDHFYDLPNVPWVMYYNGSFAVHGTYWHDKFGTPQSAGCTNVTQGDAKFIFDKVNPTLPSGASSVLSSKDNPGTVVYNHL